LFTTTETDSTATIGFYTTTYFRFWRYLM
jgi:hypothetical protein